MRRREIIVGVGTAAAWPHAMALAQNPGKVWRLGFITHSPETFYNELFVGLRKEGYVEGQNLIVIRRYAGGDARLFDGFAQEMVHEKVDVIVVTTTPAALAAKKATTTTP